MQLIYSTIGAMIGLIVLHYLGIITINSLGV